MRPWSRAGRGRPRQPSLVLKSLQGVPLHLAPHPSFHGCTCVLPCHVLPTQPKLAPQPWPRKLHGNWSRRQTFGLCRLTQESLRDYRMRGLGHGEDSVSKSERFPHALVDKAQNKYDLSFPVLMIGASGSGR